MDKFIRKVYKYIIYKIRLFISKLINLIFLFPLINKPFPKNPFGLKPRESKDYYMNLFKNAIKKRNLNIDQYENNIGYKINEKWFNNLVLYTQITIKNNELNFNHGRILYSLLSNYINKNKDLTNLSIMETGTARGFSSICMARALIDNKTNGTILTLDCISHNEKIYWNVITDHSGKLTRKELLEPWGEELSKIIFFQGWTIPTLNCIGQQRINFAFLDAQHTKASVLKEFKYISNLQKRGDIIFLDDVTPGLFDGVCQAVNEIEKLYPYKIERLNFDKNRGYAIATKI